MRVKYESDEEHFDIVAKRAYALYSQGRDVGHDYPRISSLVGRLRVFPRHATGSSAPNALKDEEELAVATFNATLKASRLTPADLLERARENRRKIFVEAPEAIQRFEVENERIRLRQVDLRQAINSTFTNLWETVPIGNGHPKVSVRKVRLAQVPVSFLVLRLLTRFLWCLIVGIALLYWKNVPLKRARRQADQVVITQGFRNFWTGEISKRIEEFRYETKLSDLDHLVLAEGLLPHKLAMTKGRQELSNMLDTDNVGMALGTIGVAGPRGVGVTTTMRGICQLLDKPRFPLSNDSLMVYVQASAGYDSRDFVIHLFSETCKEVIAQAHRNRWLLGPARIFVPLIWGLVSQNFDAKWTLRNRAEHELKTIRYQASFTSDWEGSVKVQGTGFRVGRTKSWTETPRSLPEVIADYEMFLRHLSLIYRPIFVLIDDLEKAVALDKAREILLDVKKIFGVPGCFYLIAISDEAMNQFHWREITVRNPMDSTLDSVVYIDYLDFDQSQELISGRVIGMPMPFQFVAHCYSGGLPRELIRACRVLLDMVRKDPNTNTLRELTSQLLWADILGKLRSAKVTVSKLPWDELVDEITGIVEDLHQLNGQSLEPSRLRRESDLLLAIGHNPPGFGHHSGGHRYPQSDSPQALAMELGAFLLFCSTFLQFVGDRDRSDSQWWKRAFDSQDSTDNLDRWAVGFTNARQSLSQSPYLAVRNIREFAALLSTPFAL